jgi:hypothetical protein
MSGFVSVKFDLVGKVLLAIGLIFLILKLIAYFTDWFNLSTYFIYLGISFVVLSIYFLSVVREK